MPVRQSVEFAALAFWRFLTYLTNLNELTSFSCCSREFKTIPNRRIFKLKILQKEPLIPKELPLLSRAMPGKAIKIIFLLLL